MDKDTKYEYVIDYAKKFLELTSKLPEVQNEEEKEIIKFSINFYKASINKDTNHSAELVLTSVRTMNNIKEELKTETDDEKRKDLEESLKVYEENIKSLIVEKQDSKQAEFRNSQIVEPKVTQPLDPVTQAYEISKICTEHQKELKEAEKNADGGR